MCARTTAAMGPPLFISVPRLKLHCQYCVTRIYAGSGAGTSTNLQDLNYTFDNGGNIKSLTDVINSSQKQCYTYDKLDRQL